MTEHGGVIDLFSGSGGLSLGFRWAGFNVLAAIDADEHAVETYKTNNPEAVCIVDRLENVEPDALMDLINMAPGELDAVIGGPPCQGFSESNRRTRSLANPLNYLYKDYFSFVERLEPKSFVVENVAGIKTLAKGKILADIIKTGQALGYQVRVCELNAADYGVPQIRRRVFIVGVKGEQPITTPEDICDDSADRPYVTVREAISDLPRLGNGASVDKVPYSRDDRLSNYQRMMRLNYDGAEVRGNLVTRNSEIVLERYRHIQQGHNWSALPSDLMSNYADAERCHTGIYHRLEWDKPAKVLGNFRKNMLIHPEQDRGLSVREAARLQSFPDSYVFKGSIGFQQQQVGNAVPPLLAFAVANAVRQCTGERSEEEGKACR